MYMEAIAVLTIIYMQGPPPQNQYPYLHLE